MNKNNKAFTLVELLVVVLIIGILAAIAVPQYQLAVKKSAAVKIMPLLSSMVKEQDVYYLAHGEYADEANKLDLYPSCSKTNTPNYYQCGRDFLVDIEKDKVLASYCPGYNYDFDDCKAHREFQLGIAATFSNSIKPAPNTITCWIPKEAVGNGEQVCKNLGKQNTKNNAIFYTIN